LSIKEVTTIKADEWKKIGKSSFLLVGQTGSGKSYFIHQMIGDLEAAYTPQDMKYALFDLKAVEFYTEGEDYNQKYLLFGVVTDPVIGIERLEYVSRIVDMRIRMKESKPFIFVYIEECDMAYTDNERFNKAIINIAQHGEEVNVQIAYSSSRLADKIAASDSVLGAFSARLIGQLASDFDATRLGVQTPDVNSRYDFRLIA
jgi:energy-coupling factor transporter ATP-binding protein EcfA2